MKKNDLEFYTKDDFKNYFKKMGIKKGKTVCLQVNLPRFGHVIGGAQAIIQALQSLVGDEGCIIAPCFTRSTLDPACLKSMNYSFEKWEIIRKNILGFDKNLIACDSDSEIGNQLLKNEGAVRSIHPVYSFAFLGKYDENWLAQDLDDSISFDSFLSKVDYNLLVGVPLEDSFLLKALAHELHYEITRIERAYEKKGKRNVTRTFLVEDIDLSRFDDLKEFCQITSRECMAEWIHCLSLYNSSDSIREILSIAK